MSQYQTLVFEHDGDIARIILNRPEDANGMNMAMGKELLDVAIRCDKTPAIRAVIIAANGKMFSAGGDLKSFAAYGDDVSAALQELTVYLHAAIARFARMDKPLIVAVNGAAAGAGFSLALCGDIVLAGDSAKFTMAYTAAGLTPDAGATFYLPRLVGLRKTQELILTNRRLTAAEALDWGIVTRVVADNELQQEAVKLALHMAKGPSKAIGAVKKLLALSFDNTLEAQMELEGTTIANLAAGHDGQEGMRAFLQKRTPDFTGQS